MTLTEILIILVTTISPGSTAQVTRFLEDGNEERGRKIKVFKTLMATRAYNIYSGWCLEYQKLILCKQHQPPGCQ
jgi:hypothetical protein